MEVRMTGELLTRWIGAGTAADPRRPEFADHYPAAAWSDVTAQSSANLPPAPNVMIVAIDCDAATFAAIEADGRYDGAVIWSEA